MCGTSLMQVWRSWQHGVSYGKFCIRVKPGDFDLWPVDLERLLLEWFHILGEIGTADYVSKIHFSLKMWRLHCLVYVTRANIHLQAAVHTRVKLLMATYNKTSKIVSKSYLKDDCCLAAYCYLDDVVMYNITFMIFSDVCNNHSKAPSTAAV